MNSTSSKKRILWVLVIAVIVIVIVIAYIRNNKDQGSITTDQGTATSTSTTNTKGFDDFVTYTNPTYGYKFKYEPTGPGFKLLSEMTPEQKTRYSTYMGACTNGPDMYRNPEATVLCYIGNNLSDTFGFDAASFVVTPATSTSAQDCITPDPEARTSQNVAINGIQYTEETGGDAGLSHHLAIDTFKTYRNGSCYSIDLNIESHADANDVEHSQTFKDLTGEVKQEMMNILKTFTFTN